MRLYDKDNPKYAPGDIVMTLKLRGKYKIISVLPRDKKKLHWFYLADPIDDNGNSKVGTARGYKPRELVETSFIKL